MFFAFDHQNITFGQKTTSFGWLKDQQGGIPE